MSNLQPQDTHGTLTFVRRIVATLSRDRQEHDDIVQDAMLSVHQGRETFRGESDYSTWVFQVTTNVVRSSHRRSGRRSGIAQFDEMPADVMSDFDVHSRAVASMDAARARRAIARLGPHYETVFEKRYAQGMTEGEVADDMHLTVATVKARANRARLAAIAAVSPAAA